MTNRFVPPVYQPADANGDVYAGGKLQSFFSGTTIPITTYSDPDLTTPLSNPVIADASGTFPDIYLTPSEHRFILFDQNDVQIAVYDPVVRLAAEVQSQGTTVEAQTASEGQTVFDLSNPYLTGIGGIAVYINGVFQRSPENYTETSSTRITFTSGLKAGDQVVTVVPESGGFGTLDSDDILYTQGSAGSQTRTVTDRLQMRVDADDFGAVGDGVTDDTTALTNAVAAAVATNAPLFLVPEKTYLFSQLTFPANLVLVTRGATFRADGTVVGNNVLIQLGTNTKIDALNISVPATTSDRTVFVDADSTIGSISCVADSQIANTSDNVDGAVQIRGSNVIVDTIFVNFFDNATNIYGVTTPIEDVVVKTVIAENYVRGLYIRNTNNTRVGDVYTRIASVNASTVPGHNGILIASCVNLSVDSATIDNAGEHGIRIGGQSGAEQNSKDCHFGVLNILRPGQTAFKALSNTETFQNISIAKIFSVDCAATTATGTNEDCVQIHGTDHVEIGIVHAALDAKANCSNDVVYLAGVRRVNIGSIYGENPLRFGIAITDQIADDILLAPVNTRDCGNISINNVMIITPGTDGIRIKHGNETPRHFHIRDFYIASPAVYGVNITDLAAPAQPIRLDGYVRAPGTGSYINSGSTTLVFPTIASDDSLQTFGGFSPTTDLRLVFDQKTAFSSGNAINESLFIQHQGTNAQGNYGPSIGFDDVGPSARRRAAIAAVQTGTTSFQTGLDFWFKTSGSTATSALDRYVRMDHLGSVYPGNLDGTQELGQSSLRWANTYSVNLNPGAGTVIWTSGSGSPEGVVTAAVGSLYTDTAGGASTTLYVKESGAGNTGWIAK